MLRELLTKGAWTDTKEVTLLVKGRKKFGMTLYALKSNCKEKKISTKTS